MRVILLCLLLFTVVARAGEPEGYRALIPVFWAELYPHGGTDLYCGRAFARYDRSVNIEHVFPMSWVAKALACGTRQQCRARSARFNIIESDMHNLYPAVRRWNEARGAMAYGEIPGEHWVAPGCDLEIDQRHRRVEPREAVRGDIARAMFYMEATYGLQIYARQRAMLLAWHRADPPDAQERLRNDRIERVQGTRNTFIDRPETLR